NHTNATARTYSSRSVPRPTPTARAMPETSDGWMMIATVTMTNSTSPARRIAWWRAPALDRVSSTVATPTPTSSSTLMTSCSVGFTAVSSAEGELEQDVDGVEQRLPLALGVVGVEQVHRVLAPREPGAAELQHDLARVRHPVLGQVHAGGGVAADHPQPVVGVGQPHAGALVGDPHGGLEHELLQQARLGALVEEAGAEDDREALAAGELEHLLGVADLVLAVGVERHEVGDVGQRQRVLDRRLQRGALSQVGRVAQHRGAGGACGGIRAVGAAVVDADDVPEPTDELRDDVGDDACLVVDGHEDRHILVGHAVIVAAVVSLGRQAV